MMRTTFWKNKIKVSLIGLGFAATSFLSSCGYFDDNALDGVDVYNSDTLSADCTLDPDSLNRILSENIEAQIRCLEENFEKFIRYVKRENQDYINESELGALIRRFFHGNSESIIKGLRIVFELNMILMHDERDRMSTGSVGPLFELLKRSNREAVTITSILSDLTQESYWVKREEFKNSLERMERTTKEILSKRRDGRTELNLKQFLLDLEERIDNFEIDENMIESILVMKQAFVGGDREILKSDELIGFVDNFPDLVMAGLDLYFVSERNFPEDERWLLFDFYSDRVRAIEDLVVMEDDERVFVDNERIINIARDIAPDDVDIDRYITIFDSFKKNMIGGDPNHYSFKDVNTGALYIKIFMQALALFEEYREITSRIEDETSSEIRQNLSEELKIKTDYRVSLIQEYLEKTDFPEKIILLEFLKDAIEVTDGQLDDRFNIELTPELADALFGAKIAFFGGEKESFSNIEAREFFNLLPLLTSDIFNLTEFSSDVFEEERDWNLHLFQIIERVKDVYLFDFKNFSPQIFDLNEILLLADEFLPFDDLDITRYVPTLEEVKKRIIGGPSDAFESEDLKFTLGLAENYFKRMYFYDVYYDANSELMASSHTINRVPLVYRSELENLKRLEVDEFRQDFERIARNFRYYRDENGYSYYGNYYRRNKKGFMETAAINWASQLIIDAFDDSGTGGLEIDEVDHILHSFRPVLEDLNFWSKHMDTFARNTLLLSDLFQSTSNGSLEIDSDEFTEFGSLTLMAMKVADQIMNELKKIHYERLDAGLNSICYYDRDEEDNLLFPVPCYRRYFYEIVFDRLDLKENLFKFYDYYRTSSHSETQQYLTRVEGFARDFPDDNIPMSYRDFAKLFGALLNIESTFNRFDANFDNIVDRDELDQAFVIYEDAIMAVADLGENRRKYSHSIFLYMVKNMEVPSTAQLLNFHYNPFISKDVEASRLNIGVLLYYLTTRGQD